MFQKPPHIPGGLGHLKLVDDLALSARAQVAEGLRSSANEHTLNILGTALCALYEAATCHRKCHKGGHVLEALCGRAYNLGCSAYLLSVRGFYDEALNLTRGIGEIANLVALSVVDKSAIQEWLETDARTRRTKFSPAGVRKALKQKGSDLMFADDDWYSKLCERYTHVGPGMRPNLHNDSQVGIVGAIYQEAGLKESLNELAIILGVMALQICRYFEFDDLFKQIMNETHEGIEALMLAANLEPGDEP